MDMRIPTLNIQIMLESSPLKSTILVGRSAVSCALVACAGLRSRFPEPRPRSPLARGLAAVKKVVFVNFSSNFLIFTTYLILLPPLARGRGKPARLPRRPPRGLRLRRRVRGGGGGSVRAVRAAQVAVKGDRAKALFRKRLLRFDATS